MWTPRGVDWYFNEYIFPSLFSDIESAILGKANYLVALGLLSYTEFLGGLITGCLGEKGKSEHNFNSGLKLLKRNDDPDYYININVILIEETDISPEGVSLEEVNIYKLFRCGMVHEYDAKGDCIIHNNSDSVDHYIMQDAGVQWITLKQEGEEYRI